MDEHTSHELAYKKGYEAGKQDAMKWIPVTERLPKQNADGSVNCVLVTNGRVIHMAYLSEREFIFCENGQMAEPTFYNVTHWMPLPTPPKGE